MRNIAATRGRYGYGTIESRIPEEHRPRETPIATLQKYGVQVMRPLLSAPEPLHGSWRFALAAQRLIMEKKTPLPPTLAAKIFLEAAVTMSKIDPQEVAQPNNKS